MPSEKKKQDTIADWTPAKLARFISTVTSSDPGSLPQSFRGNEIRATGNLVAEDNIELSAQALQYIKDNLPP